MHQIENFLAESLQKRKDLALYRILKTTENMVDFCSNDYLGFAKTGILVEGIKQELAQLEQSHNQWVGATGSRLLAGNYAYTENLESTIADFHGAEAGLIFNSGYDANVGFFSSVPQKGDLILYDELIHASIRDGIQLSNAKSYKFQHNDFEDLKNKISKLTTHNSQLTTIYIVTESVFSMDGDSPNLEELVTLCEKYNCFLVIDEAHALGVFGNLGEGLLQSQGLQDKVFARIMTFGKGLGCHGAAILGSQELKNYLINFARSFIYTTGLSPHSVATILMAYQQLKTEKEAIENLRNNIQFFNQEKMQMGLKPLFVYSKSAIQCAIIPGNEKVKSIANQLQNNGFDVKPILSPTVPEGQERLRFCLHSYNSSSQISEVLKLLSSFVF